jgi:hypothetical protein
LRSGGPDEDAPPTAATGATGGPPGPCVFAKAVFLGVAACGAARREDRAEGSRQVCTRPLAQANCALLLDLLRERARFALHLPGPDQALRHQQALQLQCGGLGALQQVMAADALGQSVPVPDVAGLVALAQARHGSLTELPWPALVAGAAAWPVRRRHRPR